MVRPERNPIRIRATEQGLSRASELCDRGRAVFGSRTRIGVLAAVLMAGGQANAAGVALESDTRPALGEGSPVVQEDIISLIERWRELIDWCRFIMSRAELTALTDDDDQNMLICIAIYAQNGLPQGLSPEEVVEAQQNIGHLLDLTGKIQELDTTIKVDFMEMLESALVDLGP